MLSSLADILIERAKRTPHRHLAGYMHRFVLKQHNEEKSNWAARVHNVKRSDYDRALHDHPWPNWSLVLKSGLWEVVQGHYQQAIESGTLENYPDLLRLDAVIKTTSGKRVSRADRKTLAAAGVHWRGPGAIVRRNATMLHRLIVPAGTEAWTLFVMGPLERDWGFQTPDGWVHEEEYKKILGRDA
jgi:hypothetical protein